MERDILVKIIDKVKKLRTAINVLDTGLSDKVETKEIVTAGVEFTNVKRGSIFICGRGAAEKGGLYIIDKTGAVCTIVEDTDVTVTYSGTTLSAVTGSEAYNRIGTVIRV